MSTAGRRVKAVKKVKGVALKYLILLLLLYRYFKFRAMPTYYIFQHFCII